MLSVRSAARGVLLEVDALAVPIAPASGTIACMATYVVGLGDFEKKRNVVNAFTGHLSKVLSKMADSGAKTLTDAKQASETVDSMYHIF